jgi:6-phosphofructokinase 1
MKTLIVVSGGDAPGINTVIARYTQLAQRQGDEVVGASGGFVGVLSKHLKPIDLALLRLLEGRGGTYLPSSREPILSKSDAKVQFQAIIDQEHIDNVLLFGGDGTLHHVLPLLREWQIPTIALPTTIDNDVAGTERTLGFDSACNFAYQAIEGILATAHALQGRIFMIETLGGDTGYLALDIAYATGAQAVLIPEYDFEITWFAERLKDAAKNDGFAIAILSEGVKIIPQLPEAIPRLTGIRLRYTRLGHSQRGGSVSHIDRRLASEMAQIAYTAFQDGIKNSAIIVEKGMTCLHQGAFGIDSKAKPNVDLYNFVNEL